MVSGQKALTLASFEESLFRITALLFPPDIQRHTLGRYLVSPHSDFAIVTLTAKPYESPYLHSHKVFSFVGLGGCALQYRPGLYRLHRYTRRMRS